MGRSGDGKRNILLGWPNRLIKQSIYSAKDVLSKHQQFKVARQSNFLLGRLITVVSSETRTVHIQLFMFGSCLLTILICWLIFLQEHQSNCKRFPVNCPMKCGQVIPREEIGVGIAVQLALVYFICQRNLQYKINTHTKVTEHVAHCLSKQSSLQYKINTEKLASKTLLLLIVFASGWGYSKRTTLVVLTFKDFHRPNTIMMESHLLKPFISPDLKITRTKSRFS